MRVLEKLSHHLDISWKINQNQDKIGDSRQTSLCLLDKIPVIKSLEILLMWLSLLKFKSQIKDCYQLLMSSWFFENNSWSLPSFLSKYLLDEKTKKPGLWPEDLNFNCLQSVQSIYKRFQGSASIYDRIVIWEKIPGKGNLNPSMHNVLKWSDTLLKSCCKCCNIFKCTWQFWNFMH